MGLRDAESRAASRRLLATSERELQRIVLDMHDGPVQDIFAALSQDELRAKVLAIFKHQSQKDTAPFPGAHDDREFWQRVEARNLDTAARADRLGLSEYFSMEAYVVQRDGPAGR